MKGSGEDNLFRFSGANQQIVRRFGQTAFIDTKSAGSVALGINIDEKDLFPFCADPGGKVHSGGRFTDPALGWR